jgi:hypothetical protein
MPSEALAPAAQLHLPRQVPQGLHKVLLQLTRPELHGSCVHASIAYVHTALTLVQGVQVAAQCQRRPPRGFGMWMFTLRALPHTKMHPPHAAAREAMRSAHPVAAARRQPPRGSAAPHALPKHAPSRAMRAARAAQRQLLRPAPLPRRRCCSGGRCRHLLPQQHRRHRCPPQMHPPQMQCRRYC